jgi:hypothetical protein
MEKEQIKRGQTKSQKPDALKPKIVLDERRFKEIRDLLYIEFSFDGIEVISVYDALPPQMDRLANMYANVSNVNVDVWPVEERLDFVNNLWDFCQKKGYKFPLRVKESKRFVEPIG